MPETGLLIVNADDFGGNRLATDRIAECFQVGAITSTSAMVYMSDSERAASIAPSRVSFPLACTSTSPSHSRIPARRRQFASARQRPRAALPAAACNASATTQFLSSLVRACIDDQLECFRALLRPRADTYRRPQPRPSEPHRAAGIAGSDTYAHGRKPYGREAKPGCAACVGQRGAVIARRYTTTDKFLAIDRLGSSPSAQEIDRLLAPADKASLEIMTHPDRERDHRLLMSEQWRAALQARTLGSFAALRAESLAIE